MPLNHSGPMSHPPEDLNIDKPVSAGPFHGLPPLDLWQRLAPLPDGKFRSGDDVRAHARAWLYSVLEDAGVELGAYDHEVVAILAKDCTSTVQVIAGWIRRTRPVL